MTKNVASGGYTEQQARNLMLINGIEHVKGIVPRNAPKIADLSECDDFTPIWFDSVFNDELVTYVYETDDDGYYVSDDIYHGKVRGINIRFDAKLCWTCATLMRDYYSAISQSIRLVTNVDRHYCEFCGKWESDEVPF